MMHAGAPQPGADGFAYPRPRLACQILLTLFLATVVSYMDRGIIALLVPDLKAGFALTDTQVSFVQGLAFSTFFALGSIPVGHLVDRTNRRNIVICGVSFRSGATMANLVSFGLGPTLPALLNDHIFYNEGMIRYSLMIVVVSASLIASVLTLAVRNRFARTKAALIYQG